MKKLFLSAMVTLLSISALAATDAQIEAVKAKQAAVGLTSIGVQNLIVNSFNDYENMSSDQLAKEMRLVSLKKTGACKMADIFIVTSGVIESIPVAATLPKLIAIDYTDKRNITMLTTSSVAGALLSSIPNMMIETASSYDMKKIEAVMQESFTASNKLAYKLKGDQSYCAEMNVRLDVLDAIVNKK